MRKTNLVTSKAEKKDLEKCETLGEGRRFDEVEECRVLNEHHKFIYPFSFFGEQKFLEKGLCVDWEFLNQEVKSQQKKMQQMHDALRFFLAVCIECALYLNALTRPALQYGKKNNLQAARLPYWICVCLQIPQLAT